MRAVRGGARAARRARWRSDDPLWVPHRCPGAAAPAVEQLSPLLPTLERQDEGRAKLSVSQVKLPPQEFTPSPPPAWLADDAALVAWCASPERYEQRRVVYRTAQVRDFDAEYVDSMRSPAAAARYQARLREEMRDGQTLTAVQAGGEVRKVEATGETRVDHIRFGQRTLRDFLTAKRRTAAVQETVELSMDEEFLLKRAEHLLACPAKEVQDLHDDAERCAAYSKSYLEARGALERTKDFRTAFRVARGLYTYAGDWWVREDRLKWHGESSLVPGLTIELLEAELKWMIGEAAAQVDDFENDDEKLAFMTTAVKYLDGAAAFFRAAAAKAGKGGLPGWAVRNRAQALRTLAKVHLGWQARYTAALEAADECLDILPDDIEASECAALALRGLFRYREAKALDARIADLEAAREARAVREQVYNPATGRMEERTFYRDELPDQWGGLSGGPPPGMDLSEQYAKDGYRFVDEREMERRPLPRHHT
eukprot:TRINITY_DN22305_c0_g1_i1.p2 TRINITY_DN22305_c0_g1~~TRINITY_DN22305_c0_g1_i1.p2  ORF type:complete len:484 (+),score=155.40 TRINITY_DN22305_c0_g1_i1:48-1499(+)